MTGAAGAPRESETLWDMGGRGADGRGAQSPPLCPLLHPSPGVGRPGLCIPVPCPISASQLHIPALYPGSASLLRIPGPHPGFVSRVHIPVPCSPSDPTSISQFCTLGPYPNSTSQFNIPAPHPKSAPQVPIPAPPARPSRHCSAAGPPPPSPGGPRRHQPPREPGPPRRVPPLRFPRVCRRHPRRSHGDPGCSCSGNRDYLGTSPPPSRRGSGCEKPGWDCPGGHAWGQRGAGGVAVSPPGGAPARAGAAPRRVPRGSRPRTGAAGPPSALPE